MKEIFAETISEQLPVLVEKITTQVNRADPVPDRGHLGPPLPPSPVIHNMDSIDKRNDFRNQGIPEPKNLSNAKRLEHDEERTFKECSRNNR